MPVGQKTKVSDAREPVGQSVDEKTADELAGSQCHHARFFPAGVAIVLPLESDRVLLMSQQPLIGDRDTVSIAAEISEYLLRAAEGRFGVDHPFGLAERRQISCESGRILERFQFSAEVQFPGCKGVPERF